VADQVYSLEPQGIQELPHGIHEELEIACGDVLR
jgi:hypothetical protein